MLDIIEKIVGIAFLVYWGLQMIGAALNASMEEQRKIDEAMKHGGIMTAPPPPPELPHPLHEHAHHPPHLPHGPTFQ